MEIGCQEPVMQGADLGRCGKEIAEIFGSPNSRYRAFLCREHAAELSKIFDAHIFGSPLRNIQYPQTTTPYYPRKRETRNVK